MYAQPPAYAPPVSHQVPLPVIQPTAPVVYQPAPVASAPQQGQQQTTTTVVLGQPGGINTAHNNEEVIGSPTFRDTSVRCKCNNCHKTIFTKVEHEIGACTWLCCIILFICGVPCCLCLVPFCTDRFKNTRHICPCCQTTVGVFKRI